MSKKTLFSIRLTKDRHALDTVHRNLRFIGNIFKPPACAGSTEARTTFVMKRVAIIHPWLPQYRVRFFTLLQEYMKDSGVEVDIYYGETPPEWKDRSDSAEAPGCEQLRTSWIGIGQRALSYKHLGQLKLRGSYDLVIAEQAIRNLETYILLLTRRSQPLAFWGHGKNYTVSRSRLETTLKRWVTNRGLWFFGYTKNGVDAVVDTGFPANNTTVVYNSTDTKTLSLDLAECSHADVDAFKRRLNLTGPTALYLGGLDEAKRLPLLLQAAQQIRAKIPEFSLLVGGSGDMKELVQAESLRCRWIHHLGPIFGRNKALALRSSDILLIPGRVGLVAVDSIVAGVPIVTTNWGYHAPEFEYLRNGYDCLETEDDVDAYATSAAALLQDKSLIDYLSSNLIQQAPDFSAEQMASNFAQGILKALNNLADATY